MIPEHWQYFDQTPLTWTLLIVAAMIVGFSKTGVAGVGILNPVLFAMIFPAGRSVGLLLPMLIMADFFAVGNYRKHAEWKYIWHSIPWALAGIGGGYVFMRSFQGSVETYNSVMKISIGVIVLAMMGTSFWLNRLKARDEAFKIPMWLTPVFGLLTGFTTMLANAAGPIFSIFLLTYGLPKKEFMGTRAMAFFIINWIKVPLQWQLGNISAQTLALNGLMFPAIAVGAFIGVKTLRMIPEKIFKLAIQVLVIAACLKLIWSGIFPDDKTDKQATFFPCNGKSFARNCRVSPKSSQKTPLA